ncbi:MAG: SAM-dependent methyltransferase [Phaeodactylibacter sp.]|nr:SAM-dependent methyltransferase [Phaeodactylibacter sp.]MCB9303040.1 SAM-dependent methyltransferase [Lewinellaceae bacterium]HQU57605.1 SAM-dependent methyltransferase [Saprospiraceae bacterium]
MATKGKLYLIPAPLGEQAAHTIPQYVTDILHRLDVFIAERAKTARRFIKETDPVKPFSELTFYEITKYTPPEERAQFLEAAENGQDIGLLSEAGCPGVADPGAFVVQTAHQRGIEVVPLVGPSSILLGLMASGLNGQNFCFHGYLPPKKPDLMRELKFLEQRVFKHTQTQIFIETPYRNMALIETAINTLSPDMLFCIAADLTLPTEYVRTLAIGDWRKTQIPNLDKRPAIFLLGK